MTQLLTEPVASRRRPSRTPREATLRGANRVLTMSTIAFTLMFAVWLMFGILGMPIQKEFGLSDVQLAWITAVAVLNGSLWRLPAGMLTDRIGGRVVTSPCCSLDRGPRLPRLPGDAATRMLLVLAFLVGFAGNLFSVGIAWNAAWFPRDRQGFALGVFGAGNVGASVTKFIGPPIIAGTAGATYLGVFPGGWRLVPVDLRRACSWSWPSRLVVVPAPRPHAPAPASRCARCSRPLRHVRVWRFSLYYVAVFGAYVALAAWLPKYYVDNFDVAAGRRPRCSRAMFIFPASLLRPVGGWFSDRFGARRVMYWTFGVMLVTTGILMMPNGHIVIAPRRRLARREHLGLRLGPACRSPSWSSCSAARWASARPPSTSTSPSTSPTTSARSAAWSGMLGGLGGFFLPPLFAYTKAWSGFPSCTFFVLFLLTARLLRLDAPHRRADAAPASPPSSPDTSSPAAPARPGHPLTHGPPALKERRP